MVDFGGFRIWPISTLADSDGFRTPAFCVWQNWWILVDSGYFLVKIPKGLGLIVRLIIYVHRKIMQKLVWVLCSIMGYWVGNLGHVVIKGTISSRSTGRGIGVLVLDYKTQVAENISPHDKVITEPVIFSRWCVHLKLGHRFHALFESLLWLGKDIQDNIGCTNWASVHFW